MSKVLYIATTLFLISSTVYGHFGMVLPSANFTTSANRTLSIRLGFTHPFEQTPMKLEKPKAFFSLANGRKTLLTEKLSKDNKNPMEWKILHGPKRPGVVIYGMEPQPYFEPAEDCYIIHYTKTIIGAYGIEEGWSEPAGFPIEIIPLSRPFGCFEGTSFTGKVVYKSSPLANSVVEYEYFNEKKQYTAPSDYHVTATIMTDENGVFTITLPKAGWWAVSALTESDSPMKSDGTMKSVELGGVLWLKTDQWK